VEWDSCDGLTALFGAFKLCGSWKLDFAEPGISAARVRPAKSTHAIGDIFFMVVFRWVGQIFVFER
jgi:hypothetical protein